MLDDFVVRALLAGIGVAIVAGPVGCFIVWRRMAYFGDTISHAALLGIAIALLIEANLVLGVFAVAVAVSLALLGLQRRGSLPTDALLGILAHGALALGLVAIATLDSVRVDLLSYLFGDILAVSRGDLVLIYSGGGAVLGGLMWLWRPLLAMTVSHEVASAEQLHPRRSEFLFMLLVAAIVAIAMKIVGILLITALIILPAAAGRSFARTPEQMAVFAGLAGVLAVLGGVGGSLRFDTPSGPSIVVVAFALFGLSWLASGLWRWRQRRRTMAG
ncbi:MAG: metal ABC transporter permease [Alphaproteobacteria bacterium]